MEEVARQLPQIDASNSPAPKTGRRLLARLGVGAFIFFFIKGLVWIGIGAGAWVAMKGD